MTTTPLKKVLIVGLFLSDENRHLTMRTAADQLYELLESQGVATITVSSRLDKVGRFVDTMWTIYRRRREYNIGIVPLYGGTMSYIWAALSSILLKLLGKKVVLIVHGGSIPATMKVKPGRYLRSFKQADVVVCPSAYLQNVLQQYGVQSRLIENVILLNDYHFQEKQQFRPRLFWMRTLEDVYNPEMAVRVAGLLAKKYPAFTMVMAGYDRGRLPMLKQMAEALGISDRIDFPGYITGRQKNNYATTHDIYICTNRIDNAPVTFIEMMAMGLPVVSVNVGGIPYLVKDGYNGLLVDLDDDQAMVAAIESIIEQPQQAQQMVANGLQFARGFDAGPVFGKWKTLFHELGYTVGIPSPKALKQQTATAAGTE